MVMLGTFQPTNAD